MPKLKLPMPPLPNALLPKPKRPGENGNGNAPATPLEVGIEAGVTVVDWIDERTSLSGGLRWLLFRKVPNHDWTYTLGTATMFAQG